MIARIGRGWERLKIVGIVLWPIRFVVLVMLAMIGILSLSQGKDALYGAVVEESGLRAAAVFGAVAAWALQTWYWARFLLDRVRLRWFSLRYHVSRWDIQGIMRWRRLLRTGLPRALGALVFVIVAMFVYAASCSGDACHEIPGAAPLAWVVAYLAAALVFIWLTIARRRIIRTRRAHGLRPARAARLSLPPAGLIAATAIVWLALLSIALLSAVFEWPVPAQRAIAVAIVLVLAATSAVLAFNLPLPRWTRVAVLLASGVSTVLFLLSIFAAASLGNRLGPAIVLMLTAGLWVGATSFFVAYPGEALRLPVTTLIVAAALIFGLLPKWLDGAGGEFDNHAVRAVGGMAPVASDGGSSGRVSLKAAFMAWKQQAGPCVPGPTGCLTPMVLVTAQGGASRSGYWVAGVLGALEDGAHGFHRSVFAISSVSGGSLGAAVYQRLVARKQGANGTAGALCKGGDSFALCGQRILQDDFLGPVFFSMFNADLLQRLLPGDLMPDRAEALETAWEDAWRRETGADDFAEPLQIRDPKNPAAAPDKDWLPVLLLNGSSVKTGRRIITSDIAFDPECGSSDLIETAPDLPSTLDFFCLTRDRIRLSTAVHNSARFPYISPAGTLWASDGAGHRWKSDRIVDGGYVEAQGATTLVDLLGALAAKVPDWDKDVLPILITVENDPPGLPADCQKAKPDDATCNGEKLAKLLGEEAKPMGWAMRIANDFLAPPIGLANGRTGRGSYAARALEVDYNSRLFHKEAAAAAVTPDATGANPPAAPRWPMRRFNLLEEKGPKPAMSWYLSRRSQCSMLLSLCSRTDKGNHNLDDLDKLGSNLGAGPLADGIMQGAGCAPVRPNGMCVSN